MDHTQFVSPALILLLCVFINPYPLLSSSLVGVRSSFDGGDGDVAVRHKNPLLVGDVGGEGPVDLLKDCPRLLAVGLQKARRGVRLR
jgi:hypothetical protein